MIAKEVFKQCLEEKRKLWRGEFWRKVFFANIVGEYGTEGKIATVKILKSQRSGLYNITYIESNLEPAPFITLTVWKGCLLCNYHMDSM